MQIGDHFFDISKAVQKFVAGVGGEGELEAYYFILLVHFLKLAKLTSWAG